jgi:hypothetical protein
MLISAIQIYIYIVALQTEEHYKLHLKHFQYT